MKKFAILFFLLFSFALNAQDIKQEWFIDETGIKIMCFGSYTDSNNNTTSVLALAGFIKIKEWAMVILFYDNTGKKIDMSNNLPEIPNNIAEIRTLGGLKVGHYLTMNLEHLVCLSSKDNFEHPIALLENGVSLDVALLDNKGGGYFFNIPKDENFATLFEQYEKQIKK